MGLGERVASGLGAAASSRCGRSPSTRCLRPGKHDVIEHVGSEAHLSANAGTGPHQSANGRAPLNGGRLGAESPDPEP
ncbi:hypothetical protein E2562_003524 [Oryza meyeriana var. granulata]|uniref:Uncharacterized protein n=1 Tax=Oryza meyeriana var. granulata TaxID=110450 RepID=A0A6G1CN25_9ORYZ|nr:hypothetical protein E2562_003524 [Oryza meyeriana var. granulata]